MRHETWLSLQAELYPEVGTPGICTLHPCSCRSPLAALPRAEHRLPLGIASSSGWIGWLPCVPARDSPMLPCALSDRFGDRISDQRRAARLPDGSTGVNQSALPVTTSGLPAACMGGLFQCDRSHTGQAPDREARLPPGRPGASCPDKSAGRHHAAVCAVQSEDQCCIVFRFKNVSCILNTGVAIDAR